MNLKTKKILIAYNIGLNIGTGLVLHKFGAAFVASKKRCS